VAVTLGDTAEERERLARLETKVDSILKKLDEKVDHDNTMEERLRATEIKVGIILTVGAGAWAVILILATQVFGKMWG
jgi:hypothetical protein